jgi:DNA-directed RNA polymerase subunit beta'
MHFGEKVALDMVEKIKQIGFEYGTRAGASLGLEDLKIPLSKTALVAQAELDVQFTQNSTLQFKVTAIERFQHLIDTWHRSSESLKKDVVQHFRSTDLLNPVYMMAFSGARGNISQVSQLVGMRGLMADPQGQIISFPIRSNFREGLTLTEYVISCYGARKGLVDTALRTANAGYLTRPLVDASHHVIVSQFDCKTNQGIFLTPLFENGKIRLPLEAKLLVFFMY